MQKGQKVIIYMTIKTMNKCDSNEHIVDYMMNMQKKVIMYIKRTKKMKRFLV